MSVVLEDRVAGLEERVAKIEGVLEQMDKRMMEFREDFNRRLNRLESEVRELRGRIWWVIGIQISMWITIILAILFK
ncbi:hypothetical protein [Staphylothermus marinus]|uniref:hypothetical protein n=1 Tax=Staphylothermus marinus TaxID=2280 RepID=UPI0003234945|nr:hypothetical protein [Staphylothermus marinus]